MSKQSEAGLEMGTLNVEQLAAAISEEAPCGENLERSNEFRQLQFELDKVIQGERSLGSVATPKPDWQKVRRLSLELLERTKDLRLCVYFAAASLRQPGGDLSEFTNVLSLVQKLVEDHWDTVHPQPDASDETNPFRDRVQALQELGTEVGHQGDAYKIIIQLRLVPLTRSGRGPQFCRRDIMILRNQLRGAEKEKKKLISDEKKDDAALKSAFVQTVSKASKHLENLARDARRATAHTDAISSRFEQKAGKRCTPDLGPLKSELLAIVKEIEKHLGFRAEVSGDPKIDDADPTVDKPRKQPFTPIGEISSREEVLQAIDRIQDYYRQHEPSSPVPLLLQRARRLANMNFVDIVQDIAGDAVQNMKVLLGPESTKE